MNYKKKGLKNLIKLILSGKVSDRVLTHKDRFLRFGSELIFIICKFFGIKVLCDAFSTVGESITKG